MSEIAYLPFKDPLTLALMPDEALRGKEGRRRIELGMTGIQKHSIEEIDGFDYTPSYTAYLNVNLVMLASEMNNVTLIKYWIEEMGVNPNVRNCAMWTALVFSIATGQNEVREYLQSLDDIEIGLPEAAALGLRDRVPQLVAEYDAKPAEEKLYGLRGAEVAYIFSGLSGDVDFVLSLMVGVSDVNVGAECETEGVGMNAVRSGNVELVRKLVQEHGVTLQTTYSPKILFSSIRNPDMLRFLMDELKVATLDAVSDTRCSLMESALLNRASRTIDYLLKLRPVEAWMSRSHGELFNHSMFLWNPPEITRVMAATVGPYRKQAGLRQALQYGDVDTARIFVKELGADITEKKEGYTTMLEVAVHSGSLQMVNHVLENDNEVIKYKHDNGFTALVAAARQGSGEIFRRLAKESPDRLNLPVWNGMSLLMVSAQNRSSENIQFMLGREFYEANCRGKLLDVNTQCENQRTALWYAASSGVVANVELFLSKRQWLGIRELDEQSKVNDLFLRAAKSESFVELLDCFARHGLSLVGAPSASLAMSAAENAALFSADPCHLRKLRELDEHMGVAVPDEVLLCAIIRDAPEWAVNKGCLANLVTECFASEGPLQSDAAFEQAIARCDKKTSELFDLDKLLSTQTLPQLILKALRKAGINEEKRVPHPQVVQRRRAFIHWLSEHKHKQLKEQPVCFNGKDTQDVLHALILADLCIRDFLSSSLEASIKLAQCSNDQLASLIRLASKYSQFDNVRQLSLGFGETGDLSRIPCEKETNLLLIALGHKDVTDAGRKSRLSLIKWLTSEGKISLESSNNEGTNPAMLAATLGNADVFEWVTQNSSKKLLAAQDDKGCTLVYHAAKGGHIGILEKAVQLLGKGVCSQAGETPLHVAGATGNLGLLRYLVECVKVDVGAKDIIQRTACDYCIFGRNSDAKDYLASVMGVLADADDKTPTAPRAIVKKWMDDLSASVGKNLGLNSDGICAFTYEDHTIVIEVPHSVGSVFVYASIDGREYDIEEDSWALLLRSAVPGNPAVCPSLERQGTSKANTPPTATLSVTDRISELDSKSFRNVLENFIDSVINTADRLRVCAAKRYLTRTLMQLPAYADSVGTSSQRGSVAEKIFGRVESLAVKPVLGPRLDEHDIELFKQSLSPHVQALAKSVNKDLSLDERGRLMFRYEHLLIGVWPAPAKHMQIHATLWNNNDDGEITAEVMRRALELNYLQQETRGGTLSMFSDDNKGTELHFFYEDSTNLSTVDFRNIMENFIDTALDLYRRIRQAPAPLQQAQEELEKDLRQRQVTIINDLQAGNFAILERIFGLGDPKLVKEKLDSLAFTIMDTRNLELWRSVAAMIFEFAGRDSGIDVEDLRKSIFRRVCEKAMFDDDLLNLILKEAPDSFEMDHISSVFSSKMLLQEGRTALVAQKVFEARHRQCLEGQKDTPKQKLKNWSMLASNLLSSSRREDHKELILGLDWIFSKTEEGELESCPGVVHLLHNMASLGFVEAVKYLLQRLPHVNLDEETLRWACKRSHVDLVRFIISEADGLPRAQAIKSAAMSGSVDILKVLKVGQNEEGGPLDESQSEELSDAIATVARTAIAEWEWDVLKHVLTDHRLKIPLADLLRLAAVCSSPQKSMDIILGSSYAAQQAFSCQIPWQAQAHVLDSHVLMLLRVMNVCNLPAGVGEAVWSFLKPECEPTPIISSSLRLGPFKKPLERDLGIQRITTEDGSFELPGIGSLSLQDGYCCVKKRFDTSKIRIAPDIALGMSLQLGGCFLAARDLDSALWLKRCVPLDGSFNYNELRLLLRSFRQATRIVDSVLSSARKLNVMVSAQHISAFAPDVQAMNKVRAKSTTIENGHSFEFTYFKNSKWVRITSPCSSPDLNTACLLEENMESSSNDSFFCTRADGAVCGAMYARPSEAGKIQILMKLIKKCQSPNAEGNHSGN